MWFLSYACMSKPTWFTTWGICDMTLLPLGPMGIIEALQLNSLPCSYSFLSFSFIPFFLPLWKSLTNSSLRSGHSRSSEKWSRNQEQLYSTSQHHAAADSDDLLIKKLFLVNVKKLFLVHTTPRQNGDDKNNTLCVIWSWWRTFWTWNLGMGEQKHNVRFMRCCLCYTTTTTTMDGHPHCCHQSHRTRV